MSSNPGVNSSTNGLTPNRIFVGNISRNTTESDLILYFSEFGSVKSAKIIYDTETKFPKQYCFVTFANEEIASSLIQRSSSYLFVIKGRKLDIGSYDI